MKHVLKVPKADIVGWSDGAILGLAMCPQTGLARSSPLPANTVTSGVKGGVENYEAYSATPKGYDAFLAQISKMWASQPNWTDAQLKAVAAPILVVDGDHDEAIKREHTEYIASTIPRAGLLILPQRKPFRLPTGP